MSAIPGRVAWIDAARGIGIVLVVFGHVERGLVAARIVQGPAWAWLDYGVYTFHMPLFFLLAGINVPSSLAKGRGHFVRAKLWTIAYPYVLWSLIQGSLMVAMSPYTNGATRASDLLLIGSQPLGCFWFLYVLMACQLLAAALALHPGFLLSAAIASLAASSQLPRGGLVEELLHAFPFFAAGILLSNRLLGWKPGGDARRAGIAAIGLAIAIPLSGGLGNMNQDAAAALPASVCGIVLLVSAARLLRAPALRVACVVGRGSMTIYVTHILAAAGTRIVLVRLHVAPNPVLYILACTAVGVGAPLVAHVLMQRLGLLGAFGLASLRTRRPLALRVPLAVATTSRSKRDSWAARA